MKQQDFRTYHRRGVTRKSGYHTCASTTGGECIIKRAQAYQMADTQTTFVFQRHNIDLVELFSEGNGFFAFGGYLFTSCNTNITFTMNYQIKEYYFEYKEQFTNKITANDWNNIGFHKKININYGTKIDSATVKMTINCVNKSILEFMSFDLGAITKDAFIDDTLAESFCQKTSMHIPYLYYLDTSKSFETYLSDKILLAPGRVVVLKSCNRCGRYLPINIFNEIHTMGFSLHCKKRAPCTHSTFRAYSIQNSTEIDKAILRDVKVENGKLLSYHGHQLECKACKKFFVNAPLNPQRNAQQFKEDALRRRAIELLVNHLLARNTIHNEFKQRTNREFTEYILEKFNYRCFKCNKILQIDEMHLDHTMPLSYLYRLDETATCLCGAHNSQKSDRFPVDYYTYAELVQLSKITGLSMKRLSYKGVNQEVLKLLIDYVVWFYDEFLMSPDYQKKRDGILTADKINDSLKRVIGGQIDLAEKYRILRGKYPTSVTIGQE